MRVSVRWRRVLLESHRVERGYSLEIAILRVLIVDDFEPWRRFLRSTLQKLPQLRIIDEESDGLSAVQSAEQLKPDLIVLDIGLPKVNGIEAARRIRELSPNSKILFASAHRSWDIVESALATGAGGYVVKTDAGKELLPAVDAILRGKQFVSASLTGNNAARGTDRQSRDYFEYDAPLPPRNIKIRHEVDFYVDDIAFVNGFGRVIEAALRVGTAVIVIATDSHHNQILTRFRKNAVDVDAAIEKGSYLFVGAADVLEAVMTHEMPDATRCRTLVGDLVTRAAKAATVKGSRVAICGECAPALLAEGKADAAIRLEHLWDEITREHEADTLCGYLWSAFPEGESNAIFRRICAEHSAIHRRHLGY
jgi:DNA-binding NarL/FixJ family response regulator